MSGFDLTNVMSQEELDKRRAFFAKLATITFSDIKKNETKTYDQFTKEVYRQYITNVKSNEKNIRNMSRFFYRVCSSYKRLVDYFAEIPLLYWTSSPIIDLTAEPNPDKIKKAFQKELKLLNNMNMENEFRKILRVVWREDVFYGYIYSTTDSFMIDQLDPDYCKIAQLEDGCLNFAFDFSYFDKYPVRLETADSEIVSGYNTYLKDKQNSKWQILNPKKTICIKANDDNLSEVVPPFVGIFEDLIDLIDYKSLIRNREEIQNYKLLVQKIPINEKSNSIEDFMIDLDTAIQFNDSLSDSVPDQVGVALTPMDILPVEFKPDTSESDLLSKAIRTVFDNAGTSQMLFNSDKSGSVGLNASIRTDEMMAFAILRQLERWVRRYIKYNSTSTKFSFEFLDISQFNRENFVQEQVSLAQSGVPNKFKLCASVRINPLDVISNCYIENELFELNMQFKPLSTSYTQSGNANDEGGRPTISEGDLSDSGMKTRDNEANQNQTEL